MKFLYLLFAFFSVHLCASEVSLRAMASQMVMVGFHGSNLKDTNVKAMLSDAGYGRFGGVMLLARNVSDKENLKALTKAIKEKNGKIFIAIDEEGGNISRLKSLGFTYPSAFEVAQTLNISQTYEMYVKMARNLKELGINLNFAPVLDLHDINSPIIGAKERAYSQNATKISFYANSFLRAFAKEKVLTTLKHFPGHGSSAQDSHKDKTIVALDSAALLPYEDAINKNLADIVMVGHLYVDGLDVTQPATFSKKVINDLLRKQLGFKGVVISDDMLMKGVGEGALKDKIVKFINAGGDILLFSEFKISKQRTAEIVVQHIIDGVNEKKISKERIKASYDRIMALKKKI
ncbi:glycoside hydrolase family 3 protein [Campylobacter sp. RM9344]|uniref:beta-N-acetylhexosaminidase n=1 Tax=Campylobacter californiensis TaxID=1032243 RepID=A0AAW3ZW73_9BACT|nr:MULTISPECIES: glycoside hydrolase family 3 protein [unclassified Campylobacter]MBE2983752.1 glycoside hydrolase family 3 protein [Campylobacter sp. RM6883]MBE2985684.1 glycoside hydrolase family 3 protein [Campylobacter sp. RM12919]MBE2987287.1 glycoside hydrolase family 3 protein [Campylobacter sp. RM12920]MBE2994291.1 glycoside hydrolase family 3 protein [Campylobacter sp. RM6913]MBE3028599.1 glycoside hydrolase family 3 protein [Campylobacter sp. RM9344]